MAQAICEKYRALGYDISYIHRDDRTGFKAGALNHGLKSAKGEFVAMFDADFLPTEDFLENAVPHFADDKVAFIQGCWDHLNRDFNILTQVQAILLDGHFVFEHTARNRSKAFFNFSGTAGMWRVSAIEDAGGWEHDTITEDADLSYRAQLKGWRGVYLKDLVVPAELPVEVNAFKSQQHRWAKGNAQVIRKLMKTIWTSKASLHTKLECWFHLTANCNYMLMVALAIIMVPCMILRAGTPWYVLLATDGPFFLLNAVSVGLYFGLSQREVSNNKNWTSRLKYIPGLMSLGIRPCWKASSPTTSSSSALRSWVWMPRGTRPASGPTRCPRASSPSWNWASPSTTSVPSWWPSTSASGLRCPSCGCSSAASPTSASCPWPM